MTLLVIATLVATAFFVYRFTAVRRITVVAYFNTISPVGKAIASALVRLVASLVTLLAAGAEACDANEPSGIAPSGGVLNYRTGKLDDGTDPVGWYEND